MRLHFLHTWQVRVFMLRGVHIMLWIIFPHLTTTIMLLWISYTNNILSAFLTGSRVWPLLGPLLSKESTGLGCQSQFLPKCSVWDGAQDGPGFPVLCLQSARSASFVADAEKIKNSPLLFQIKNPHPFFFLMNPSQTNEEFWPRGWFYPLTTNNSRNNALVVLCDTQSQKTVASSLFLTGIFMCSKPHPQEWKQHQLKFRWCEHEWLRLKKNMLFRFQSMFYQSAKEISLAGERGGFVIPRPPTQAQISCHVNEKGLMPWW